jgi:hypothetical protein
MSLSNFGRKKAGKLDANARFWKIWELEVAPENLNFLGIYGIIKG